jgi:DNA-binding CsgD family transcriptional regulator
MREAGCGTVDHLPGMAMQALPCVVDAVGTERFGRELITFLNDAFGAEHCTLFRYREHVPSELISASHDGTNTARDQFSLYMRNAYWRNDPILAEMFHKSHNGLPAIHRMDVETLTDGEIRHLLYAQVNVRERMLLCSSLFGRAIGLCILRPEERGMLSNAQYAGLEDIASVLLSIVAKHAEMMEARHNFFLALRSVEEMEITFQRASVAFPKREAEVCARMLFGITPIGIALDLGISEDTVITYKRRAFQRLHIGSQRELLIWLVEEWISIWGPSALPN